jgi:hypothetical protein
MTQQLDGLTNYFGLAQHRHASATVIGVFAEEFAKSTRTEYCCCCTIPFVSIALYDLA